MMSYDFQNVVLLQSVWDHSFPIFGIVVCTESRVWRFSFEIAWKNNENERANLWRILVIIWSNILFAFPISKICYKFTRFIMCLSLLPTQVTFNIFGQFRNVNQSFIKITSYYWHAEEINFYAVYSHSPNLPVERRALYHCAKTWN